MPNAPSSVPTVVSFTSQLAMLEPGTQCGRREQQRKAGVQLCYVGPQEGTRGL